MRLFITGISGLLGLNVALAVRERVEVGGSFFSHPVSADGLDVYAADARDPDAMTRVLERARPDVILHTVGLSNVDVCEDDPEHAYELNVATAREGARLASACGARFIHVSTDHLFDGERAWRREDDALAPRNVYAKTKGEAEHAVLREHPDALVVRTNFYGWGTSVRTSFSDWVLRALTEGRPLTMFGDVHFTPILVNDLAESLLSLIEAKATGLIHVAGGERVSKYEYAVRAAEVFGLSADRVRAVPADSVMLRAPRPRDMSLACGRAETILGRPMPSLRDGLLRLRALHGQGWPRVLQAAIDAEKG